jgi:hypothetical protein
LSDQARASPFTGGNSSGLTRMRYAVSYRPPPSLASVCSPIWALTHAPAPQPAGTAWRRT